jgi:hypothetical protein
MVGVVIGDGVITVLMVEPAEVVTMPPLIVTVVSCPYK